MDSEQALAFGPFRLIPSRKLLLENDKQPCGDDRNHRKHDGDCEQVLSFAERVRARKHNHRADDVQNQNAVAECNQQRTDGKDQQYAN